MEEGFAEMLIAEVQKRPALWNRKFKHYRNRVVIDKDWGDVADCLGITKEAAKLKWRNLRDNFKKELKKIPKANPDGSSELVYKGKWSYFAHMLFLKDILEPQNAEDGMYADAENHLLIENSLGQDNDSEGEQYVECPLSPDVSLRTDSMSETSEVRNIKQEPRKGVKRKNSDSYDTNHTDSKSVKLMTYQHPPECEDMHFFRSILPYMTMLPAIKKLQVRNQFHFVLIKEISSLMEERARKSNNLL